MKCCEFFKKVKEENSLELSNFILNQLFEGALEKRVPFSFWQEEISNEQIEEIKENILRLKKDEPLQYILGEWEFYGFPFYVGEGVLIPRADTETVVDCALEILKGKKNPVVADFCAGTGAIGISVAKNADVGKVYAVELFDKASQYLIKNIELNKCNQKVEFLKADILKKVDIEPLDMLISNPPYITADEMKELSPVVKKEPQTALFGGDDGLTFYRALAKRGKELLKKDGALVLEIGWKQSQEVSDILLKSGYKNIKTTKDLCGNDRCITAFI